MTAQATRPVAVDELRRAWVAIQAGDFRRPALKRAAAAQPRPASTDQWRPASDERVVPVVGATGSCGATTVALALATVADGRARVVECASAPASGLAAASVAELGSDGHGWVHGTRDHVRLERADGVRTAPNAVPTPPPTDTPVMTVIDLGSQIEQVMAGDGWLTRLLADAPTIVVAARASVPGVRRLESALHLLNTERVVAAVVGPPQRRWPRALACTVGELTSALLQDGRVVVIPESQGLALHGLTPDPLPASLLTAARALLPLIEGNPDHVR